ncbi:PREDICTED: dorsal-ventral patterning tolloid-like protein 1 [Branchiostoma belcheri]|uniref:Metalloendopeptidase n=1 Tax=Branchiostoma belcheri TaxID=7741 RepID=A0A6P4YP12_BRABE|nr:PREDICTED: dorsal-ventral patterning tolloid-like protein 1 [Branchiostoma belcheri]
MGIWGIFAVTFLAVHCTGLPVMEVRGRTVETVMDKILAANRDTNLFEGDIPQTVTSRNGIRDVSKVWATRIIPYELRSGHFSSTEQAVIQEAMDEYAVRTCITLVPRTNEVDYLDIHKGSGCWSYVGVQGGRQELSLGNGCVYHGIAIHEFMHAAGFWHEQSRYDRDEYVIIQWENIQSGTEHNFNRYSEVDVTVLGQAYDFGSVMHYSATAFSSNGSPTIVARDPEAPTLGQRNGFSDIDVAKLNALYSCHMPVGWSEWTEWSPCDETCTKTRRRFCSDPNGCEGHNIETESCPWPCQVGIHPDCGQYYFDGAFGEIRSPGYPGYYLDMATCRYMINATAGSTISMSFLTFDVEDHTSCGYDVLKVYDGGDTSSPLVATLCGSTTPSPITSSGDRLMIEFATDPAVNGQGFVIQYTTVPTAFICSFDADLCGFTQDGDDQFDWTRNYGRTTSSSTGPPSDAHGSGYYMFIEASGSVSLGDAARLRTPTLSANTVGYCLFFQYHMYGVDINTLNVYVTDGNSVLGTPEFSVSGDQGNMWLPGQLTIPGDADFQLVFEGTRGSSWRGDIAIDDVVVFEGTCA